MYSTFAWYCPFCFSFCIIAERQYQPCDSIGEILLCSCCEDGPFSAGLRLYRHFEHMYIAPISGQLITFFYVGLIVYFVLCITGSCPAFERVNFRKYHVAYMYMDEYDVHCACICMVSLHSGVHIVLCTGTHQYGRKSQYMPIPYLVQGLGGLYFLLLTCHMISTISLTDPIWV